MRGTLLDEPIVFPPGQTEIPEDFQASIRDAAPKLANYPTFRVVVEAHVSPGDSSEADQALSEARALEVKRFLVDGMRRARGPHPGTRQGVQRTAAALSRRDGCVVGTARAAGADLSWSGSRIPMLHSRCRTEPP